MNNGTAKLLSIVLLVVAVIGISIYSIVRDATSAPVSKADITDIVEEYILSHPETLVDALNKYQQDMQNEMQLQTQNAIKDNLADLEKDKLSPFVGNPNAKKVVVEFFDYSCGYCKQAFPSLKKLAADRSDIKIIFKEFPILGDNSVLASRAALAVHKVAPAKYLDFHGALMQGRVTGEASLKKAATDLGIDWEKVSKMMNSAEVNKALQKNRELATTLSIRGTPAFIINGTLIPGAISYESMVEAVDAPAGSL